MSITIRYNKTSAHLEGLEVRTSGGGQDMGSHVSYAPNSHCSALTRGATRMGYGAISVRNTETDEVERQDEWDNAEAALTAYNLYVRTRNVKPCQKCINAAEAMI